MDDNDINFITLREWYLVTSEDTGEPYIGEDYECYMFEAGMEADSFMAKNAKLKLDKAAKKAYQQAEFAGKFYGLGIRKIMAKASKSEKYRVIEVGRTNAAKSKRYYAPGTCGNVLRLAETGLGKYLKALRDEPFLAPARIEPGGQGKCPEVHYAYAAYGDGKHTFILFMTMMQFDRWNEKQGGIWKPLAVTISTSDRIRGNAPVVIDPEGLKIGLTDKQLSYATKKDSAGTDSQAGKGVKKDGRR